MILSKLFLKFSKFLIFNIVKGVKFLVVKQNDLIVIIKPFYLIQICKFLKKNTNFQFKLLIDIIGIDYPLKTKRFIVIYNFLSIRYNERIFIKCHLANLRSLHSLTSLFPVAGWFEREIWDMFGIFFVNNFDLRRILTDYGTEGHPFRKDFPLTGYMEVRYDENQKRIISEFLEISQEYRIFNFFEG